METGRLGASSRLLALANAMVNWLLVVAGSSIVTGAAPIQFQELEAVFAVEMTLTSNHATSTTVNVSNCLDSITGSDGYQSYSSAQ